MLTLAAALLLLHAPPPAQASAINFDAESPGFVANGFTTAAQPGVRFSDTQGAHLELADFGVQSHRIALGVNRDDDSELQIDFDHPAHSLSLDFGNDDERFAPDGSLALLRLFLANSLVGESSVLMNRNDLMDQSLAFSGAQFDRALFSYTDRDRKPLRLIEVVDDISFGLAPRGRGAGRLPEPGSALLAGLALGGLAWVRARGGAQRLKP